ncbi:AraC family transcriptional regulator [Inhella inkyongensis]|uniref:AraC family transcriptional regulator n=1 Tax=Inhella inkyongensis TaxID=392593 RepID=A0A840S1U4_9BURK|nr:AraC family transcriptional regulator [Inhella inkyongensis]MBB5203056.1 AraC family transcriptional regulator [Inhella inkyongensis]
MSCPHELTLTCSQPVLRAMADPTPHQRRLNAVLDHIDRHLHEPLDLNALAAVAHFSPFHFHRLFVAWLGESAASYLTRRRLEVAALALGSGAVRSVTEAALQVGFGSPEAFARAFKRQLGLSPSAWQRASPAQRQQVRKFDQAAHGLPGQHGLLNQTEESNFMMLVRVQELSAVRVAYQRRMGAYGPQIGQFWAQTVRPWLAAQGLEGEVCYGVGWDDPHLTAPAQCRYDACVELPSGFKAPPTMNVQELPGGRYALAAFHGTGAEVARAWTWLLRDWFPRSGHQLDLRPFFERIEAGTRPDPQTGVFRCELCIPLQ